MSIDYGLIGKKIKKKREDLGYSVKEFCIRANIELSTLYNLENGKSKVSCATLVKIANVFEIGIDELISDELKINEIKIYRNSIMQAINKLDKQDYKFIVNFSIALNKINSIE